MLVVYQRDGLARRGRLILERKSEAWELIGPEGGLKRNTTPVAKPLEVEVPADTLRVVLIR
jgi:hypothetical protein